MLGGKADSPTKEVRFGSEKSSRISPSKSKTDMTKLSFTDPPAPPPSVPLPEKPDVARALADPVIQPLLRRSDTAKPTLSDSSPTRRDHSSDILRLCEELKLAKGQLSNQSERMKSLEDELAQERTARESAEERAQRLEQIERKDSSRDVVDGEATNPLDRNATETSAPDLQIQLDRLRATMDEMKMQMEGYRKQAETAETERDAARQTLAEMVEQRRKDHAEASDIRAHSRSRRSTVKQSTHADEHPSEANGHAIGPAPSSPTSDALLERAGVEEGRPITPEQAKLLTEFLTQEVLSVEKGAESSLVYHGRPLASAVAVIFVGFAMMTWMNGWPKVER